MRGKATAAMTAETEAAIAEAGAESDLDIDEPEGQRRYNRDQQYPLQPLTSSYAIVPEDAVIDAAQAESALGRNMADDLDSDLISVDKDVRAEEEELLKVTVNNPGESYACLAADLSTCTPALRQCWSLTSSDTLGHLSAQRFHMSAERAGKILADSVAEQRARYITDAFSESSCIAHDAEVAMLDPTQRQVYDQVKSWSQAQASSTGVAPIRLVVLGTAGTGKTSTTKCAVAAARLSFKSFDAVAMVAHTGVAAANMGGGATTIDKFFKLAGDSGDADLEHERLDEMVAALSHIQLLVIDEISTVGAVQFEMIHRRLQQVHEHELQQGGAGRIADGTAGFGNIGLMVVGDFGQLPPVCASSLIGSSVQEHHASGMRGRAGQGQRRFQTMQNIIRLRRIYRQKAADDFKLSTIRLRDYVSTPTDYELWKSHELQGDGVAPAWDGSETLLTEALNLVVENEACGSINGKKLALMSSTAVIVRAQAFHNDNRCLNKGAEEFRQIRALSHLCVGAPVMLTQNFIWDQQVVPLGLMNGARGHVVSILYKQVGEARSDGLAIPTGFPNGIKSCPMPDMVIVNFPSYLGQSFFPDLPRTWVPVPCVDVRHEKRKMLRRVGLPLRLCWAMTVHKCQGITAREGTIVDFQVSRERNPVSTAGLAFVAFTRAEVFERVAFRNLPPFHHFLAPRSGREFKNRESYESRAAEWATSHLMRSTGWTLQDEYEAHLFWSEKRQLANDLPPLSFEEQSDIKAALFSAGVTPMDPEVIRWLQAQSQLGDKASMADIARAFRGHRTKQHEGIAKKAVVKKQNAKVPGGSGKEPSAKRPRSSQQSGQPHIVLQDILVDLGFPIGLVRHVMMHFGDDPQQAYEVCATHMDDTVQNWDELVDTQAQLESAFSLAQGYLRAAGFDVNTVLPAGSSSSSLLTMGDGGLAGSNRMESLALRRDSKYVKPLRGLCADTYEQYLQRSNQAWPGLTWRVHDFGQQADKHCNACFWLSVVAGWSRLPLCLYEDHRLNDLSKRVHGLHLQGLDRLHDSRPLNGCDALGECAHTLRKLVVGLDGFMLEPDQLMCWISAYAALQAGGQAGHQSSHQSYRNWLKKVSTDDFADELVLAATAKLIAVQITVVPFTPSTANAPWIITAYPANTTSIQPGHALTLGNNDVHYVLLAP